MDTGQTCDVCQSDNFFEENGQYWCSECNTMSQHVTAVLVDQTGPIAPEVNEDFDQTDDSMTEVNDLENTLTSFELLTKVLRGLVLQLIDLGVSPELYKVSKVLWLTYLKKCGIILNKHKQPVLPALINQNDIEILYGVHGVSRKKVITGSSRRPIRAKAAHSRTSTSSISKNRKQRKLMQQLMLEDEGNESTIQSLRSSCSPQSSRHSSDYETDEEKIRDIKLAKGAEKFLRKQRAVYHRKDRKHNRLLPNISFTCSIERKKMHIGVTDVLSVLWVSLLYTGSSHLQLSDLYRLVTDGHLNLDNIERFVPEKYRNYMNLRYWFRTLTRRSFLVRCGLTCNIMEMTHIRTCDIRVIIRRYVAELALPEDLLQYTDKVCALSSPPTTILVPFSSRLMPEYDLIAMAIILVTLKILFGLDDTTEIELSHVAKKINKHPGTSERDQFEWSSWSEYIECRKAVVGSVHNITFQSTYSRLISHRLAAQTAEIKSDRVIKKEARLGGSKRLKPILLAGLHSVRQEMRGKSGEDDSQAPMKPPLAVKPDETYLPQWTKEILAHPSHSVHPKARRILERDFTQSSLDFLNPSKFTELCTRRDISCGLQEGRSTRAPTRHNVPMRLFMPVVSNLPVDRILTRVTQNMPPIKQEIDHIDEMLARDLFLAGESSTKDTELTDLDMVEDDNSRNVSTSKDKSSRSRQESSGESSKQNPDHGKRRNSDELTLLVPWHQYWVVNHHNLLNLHGTRYKYVFKQSRLVSRSIGSLCPVNFVWLLNQCASIVRSQPYHLYASLCLLENDLITSEEESNFWPGKKMRKVSDQSHTNMHA